jgi:glycosyltransferase involved in cell wall biosynthesis
VNYLATRFHEAAGYYDLIKKFVAPSRFMKTKMVQGGWEPERIDWIPTFVDSQPDRHADNTARPLVLYVGRLDATKGAQLLIDAARALTNRDGIPAYDLKVIGAGDDAYERSLRHDCQRYGLDHVSFEGWKPNDGVRELLRRARFLVVPSLWYENSPNSVLESMAEGTPVIGPSHGCFPEVISPGRTGALFDPGRPESLADEMERLLKIPPDADEMGRHAQEFVRTHHSPERHYELLENTFSSVMTHERGSAQWICQ